MDNLNKFWFKKKQQKGRQKTKWPPNFKIENNSLISWATDSRFCMEVCMDCPNKLWEKNSQGAKEMAAIGRQLLVQNAKRAKNTLARQLLVLVFLESDVFTPYYLVVYKNENITVPWVGSDYNSSLNDNFKKGLKTMNGNSTYMRWVNMQLRSQYWKCTLNLYMKTSLIHVINVIIRQT